MTLEFLCQKTLLSSLCGAGEGGGPGQGRQGHEAGCVPLGPLLPVVLASRNNGSLLMAPELKPAAPSDAALKSNTLSQLWGRGAALKRVRF